MSDANSIYGAEIDAVIKSVETATENIGMKLYHLGKMTEVIAFACEARRTLEGISGNLEYFPEIEKNISDRVEAPNNWNEFKDSTGEVLQQVAVQIAELNSELSDSIKCVRHLRNTRVAIAA